MKLTDLTSFAGTLANNDLLHIVDVSDTTQDPAGSSYKLTTLQLSSIIGSTFTAGSVIFSNGTTLDQDNTSFFWDVSSNELGIGTNAPEAPLDVRGIGYSTITVRDNNAGILLRNIAATVDFYMYLNGTNLVFDNAATATSWQYRSRLTNTPFFEIDAINNRLTAFAAEDAVVGSQLKNSSSMRFISDYWNGSNSISNTASSIQQVAVSTAPSFRLDIATVIHILDNTYVGIGTSTPDNTLHLVGTLKFVDGNQLSGKVLTSDANGVATWGFSGFRTVRVAISSAQILSSFTTPIEIIPNPGAGFAIEIIRSSIKKTHNGTDYVHPSGECGLLASSFSAEGNAMATGVAQIIFGASGWSTFTTDLNTGTNVSVYVENNSVVFKTFTADPTVGNGTIVIHACYRIVTV